ncbi:MAG: hypothetical protein DRP85_08565 [Candidatus Makaraimicrobium thalassicum]|nr:MAG: hypothetical protein DRP85_08565 [Candidatus Omnitrophota bacterium]
MILLKMAQAFLIGLIGHQSNGLFNQWEDRDRGAWVLFGRYAVGIVLVTIAAVPFVPKKEREKAVLILFGVSTCVGAGVAAGYVIDELIEDYGQINHIDI